MTLNREKKLGLFPLTAHILPGGRMHLRVFEPRYMRLVKDSLRTQEGFGLCMLNSNGDLSNNEHIYPIGTLVKIIDFESLEDGYLGITIVGERLFDIKTITTEKDGLRVGDVVLRDLPQEVVGNSAENETDENSPQVQPELSGGSHDVNPAFVKVAVATDECELKRRLQEVFTNYPEFARLYPEQNFDDARWVCNRWLEILPLPAQTKQELLRHDDAAQLQAFLRRLFDENTDEDSSSYAS
ncbi:peptidase S16 [Aliidiomarina iranensis]|uniref:Peptidase S16 n=1 Tax=Aliidiomarina iranensis TaxID=1434071 RepID=A0A432VZX2_9GAMM|nr:LON peptidase substrate-binding domain-containing protein [Aliidiomarina iranensis]RUO22300.1 peptidase S16 [Aliidiomarina iranensis]